ncbi:uncharacterized protein LOC111128072 isoform X3 [Crassostrea virginica]
MQLSEKKKTSKLQNNTGVVQQNEIVRETTPLPPNIPTARIEETSKLQNNTGENEEKDEEKGIVQRLKNSLLKVKVSLKDARSVEQQLDRFSQWDEDSECIQLRGISIDKFSDCLADLQQCYKGISPEDIKKMKLIAYGKDLMARVLEWKFNTDNDGPSATQASRYGIMALAKSSDGKFIDCMLAVYSLQFKLAGTTCKVETEHSALWGLIKWITTENREDPRYIEREEIKKFQNFFRHKALKAFESEGLIDSISYTDHKALQ